MHSGRAHRQRCSLVRYRPHLTPEATNRALFESCPKLTGELLYLVLLVRKKILRLTEKMVTQ